MSMRAFAFGLVVCLTLVPVPLSSQNQPELRWGGDAEGGAPYVEADATDPTRVVGFDVEIAQLLASGLGRTPRFVQVGFTSIDAAASRGDFDIGLSGIEDTPARRARLAVTVPYYEFREVLTVRSSDKDRYGSLADLRGHRVATLGATLAYDLLVDAERREGIIPVTYEDDVHPYSDLVLGRVDAVVLDAILAQRGVRRNSGLTNQPAVLAVGHYVGILSAEQSALRDRMNAILRDAMRDGRLERIFRRWNVWNDDQPRLYARVLADTSPYPVLPSSLVSSTTAPDATTMTPEAMRTLSAPNTWQAARRYLPALLRAAVITVALSCLSMALAVVTGALIASGRVYGTGVLRVALTGYVEVIRGTPLLLQLFVLYFGLAAVVQLPAFLAALLGLGLNYAAYESEIYRSALLAVPGGQLDAARILGLTERQVLTLVRAASS